jgi:hypothetical protein
MRPLFSFTNIMRIILCIYFCASFSTNLFAQFQKTWEYKYLDFQGATIAGESLLDVGEIPQGYLGIGLTTPIAGKQTTTINLLNHNGENIRYFPVERIGAKEMFYNAEDSCVIYHGWEYIGAKPYPCIAKIDLYGNVKWIERHEYPDCRTFFKGAMLPNKQFMLLDQAKKTISVVRLDSLGRMIEVIRIGKYFDSYLDCDIQLWSDSTVMVVANGQNAIVDSLLPLNDCGSWGQPYSDGTYFAELDFSGKIVRELKRYNYEDHDWVGDLRYAKLPGKRIARLINEYRSPNPPCESVAKVVCYDTLAQKVWEQEISKLFSGAMGCWTDANSDVLAFISRGVSPTYTYPNGTTINDGIDQFLKLDGETGKIIWHKAFMGPGVDQKDRAFFNDLTPTSDGGLLLGLSYVATPTSGAEKWFVKLDSAGCLIPGCDSFWLVPTSSASTVVEEQVSFELFPNPAISSVQFKLDSEVNSGVIVFSHIGGSTVRYLPFTGISGEVQINTLESGVYFVSVYDEHKILRALRKLVIAR